MFKTILFDLDETIFDFKKSEAAAVANALKQIGVTPNEKIVKRYSEINESLWKKLEKGEISRHEVLTKRFEILFDELSVDFDSSEMKKIYEKNLSQTGHLIDGAVELLEKIYQKYNLYIVSNGTLSVQLGRIKCSKIGKYFKELFISEVIGSVKPQKQFFDYCFERIPDINLEETLIVGDSLSSDILGGNNAGIKTCWFNPNHQINTLGVKVDYEVSKLDELLKII